MTNANQKFSLAILFVLSLIFSQVVFAKSAPKVGRKAAARYFGDDVEPSRKVASDSGSSSGESLLMLAVGGYSNSTCYRCKGSETRSGSGKATYGITYLYDRWGSMDVNLRFDFNEYKLDDQQISKLSILPLWTFPMAESRFPLYFGGGAGLGVFFSQVDEESNISFDYQLVVGARVLDLVENFGAFVEFGMKNHLYLLSDGQFNGTALSAGAVFTF